jgi:D-alanyl-D-alanine dipeptidase
LLHGSIETLPNKAGKVAARLDANFRKTPKNHIRSGSWVGGAPPPNLSQSLKACTSPKGERFEDGTIDFGTGYDCLDALANSSNALVGGIALRNRQTLKSYMQGAGFRPYAKEWWHFELINEPFNRGRFDFEISPSPSSNERPTR